MDTTTIQTLARARPVRIAFFIPTDNRGQRIIDAIFEAALALWAGRFSLIVPCDGAGPIASYAAWLRAYDPDVIYSYVDLTDEQQLAIHEDLYPSQLVRHPDDGDGDNARLRPDLPFKPLGVASLLPLAGMPNLFNPARGIRLVSAMGTSDADRLVRDSFGSDFALRNSLRSRLAPFGSSLIVIPPQELQPRGPHVVEGEEVVADVPSLFRAMASSPRDLGLTQLSALGAPRLSLDDRRWGRSFNLVVGDTAADRIMYWNARFFVPAWRDGQLVDMCVPPDRFNDAEFVSTLAELLQRRNTVDDGHNNSVSRITLRSISLTQDQLEPLRAALGAAIRGQVVACEQVASLDGCVPDPRTLEYAGLTFSRSYSSSNPWKESYSTGHILRLPAPRPDHLRVVPPEALSHDSGAWAVDLDIERVVNHSPHDNVRHRWRLPRRLRVATAFCGHYQITTPHGPFVGPRVSSGDLLTVFTVPEHELPPITLPADSDAIRSALQSGRDWTPFRRRNREHAPTQLCYDAERSDAGQHFYGTFQLFGSVRAAASVLLHAFWRDQLEKLGATGRRAAARHDRVRQTIVGRLAGVDPNAPGHLDSLANIVLQMVNEEKTTIGNRSWGHISEDFEAFVTRFVASNRHANEEQAEAIEEERNRYRRNLRDCLQRLCELEVFHQGYELKCPKCLHKNWIGIEDLKTKIPCQVCHEIALPPVERPWQFRLNGFIRDALQRHGTGPLFWVLGRCQRTFRDSFWFEGPLNIFSDHEAYEQRRVTTDIDLTVIHKGKVIMCEAKQSERVFVNPGRVAQNLARLRPDVALIAVMEQRTAGLDAKFAEFSQALEGTGVEPQMWTLDEENDISDDPWFFT